MPNCRCQWCGAKASSEASYSEATISATAFSASGPVMVVVHVSSCPGRSLETKRSHFTLSFMFDHGTVT